MKTLASSNYLILISGNKLKFQKKARQQKQAFQTEISEAQLMIFKRLKDK